MSASTTVVLECTNSAEFYRAIDCVKALNEVLGIVADHPSRQSSPDTLCILHTLLDDFLAKILDGVEEIEVVDHGDEENPLRSFILDDGEDAETCELLDIDDIKDILIDAAKRHAADLSLTSDCTYSKGLTAHEFVLGDTHRPIRIDLNLNSHDPHGAVLSMGVAYVLSFFVVVPKTEAQLWQEYKTANGCQVISIDDSSFFRSAKVTYRCATGKTIVKRESHAMRSGN